MLKYFDDIIGKDLGMAVVGQLLFYFAVFMTPVAMPLAVLLSALITFGNLGEHFELTAIKSSGISLIRTLRPIFFFVLLLTAFAFYVNNNLVPKAALEAYSLLYDIKQKKPALDLREGTFYNGISDISIKVNKKFPHDEAALKEIIVYDHRKNDGNKEVTVADSGRMSTILNERYLKFELFNGYNYTEGATQEQEMTGQKNTAKESLTRSKFSKTQVVFDLSSFQLARTDKKWFQGNRIMRNLSELDSDIDSINREVLQQRLTYYSYKPTYFNYLNKNQPVRYPVEVERYKVWKDSVERSKYVKDSAVRVDKKQGLLAEQNAVKERRNSKRLKRLASTKEVEHKSLRSAPASDTSSTKSSTLAALDSIFDSPPTREVVQAATNTARQSISHLQNSNTSLENYGSELRVFEIQWHKILASSLACVAMFLIGAPLGAIIKKGGLGVPFLVSILFFIVYYLLNMQGEKLAKRDVVSPFLGVWGADIILFIIGLIFLRQARIDARLFDADSYLVAFDKLKKWIFAKRFQPKVTT